MVGGLDVSTCQAKHPSIHIFGRNDEYYHYGRRSLEGFSVFSVFDAGPGIIRLAFSGG